jgi:hypothetical protein
MAQFYRCFIKKIATIMAPTTKLTKKTDFSFDEGMSKGLGVDQTKVYPSTNIDITKLACGISCSYICIIISY